MRLGMILKDLLWLLAALGCCAVPPSAHAQGYPSRSITVWATPGRDGRRGLGATSGARIGEFGGSAPPATRKYLEDGPMTEGQGVTAKRLVNFQIAQLAARPNILVLTMIADESIRLPWFERDGRRAATSRPDMHALRWQLRRGSILSPKSAAGKCICPSICLPRLRADGATKGKGPAG
jgi:hypothetical protein